MISQHMLIQISVPHFKDKYISRHFNLCLKLNHVTQYRVKLFKENLYIFCLYARALASAAKEHINLMPLKC